MRRSIRFSLLALTLGFPLSTSGSPGPDDKTNPITATVESTLVTAPGQIRQFAFDGDPQTFYASTGKPTGSDHFSLVLEKPVGVKSIEVATGRADGSDRLMGGLLEFSADGKEFQEVAKFQDGVARFEAKDRAVQAIRISPGPEQVNPLVIREITLGSIEPVATFKYPVEYTIDVADAPEMKEWAEEVAKLCEVWYPRINDFLKSDGYKPPTQVSLSLKANYTGVAEAGGNRIKGSVKFFKEHPDDLGAMIHETCHVVQRYRGRRNPGWLVEGVADYFRFFIYEPGKAGPVNPRRAHYNGSYRTTATFLAYVSEKYDKELVSKLNVLMREGRYKEEEFKNLTGKTVQELDEEWLASLRK